MPGGNQPVLVDRQNIVLWADMPAASAAGIAAEVRGTSLDLEEPQEGKPTHLTRSGAQAQPGLIGPTTGGPPQLAAHAAAARAVSDGERPDGPPLKESAGDRLAADWRRVSAQWTADYERRRRQALADLPAA